MPSTSLAGLIRSQGSILAGAACVGLPLAALACARARAAMLFVRLDEQPAIRQCLSYPEGLSGWTTAVAL